ncbi:hypothetical protein Syun_031287 [Stephania yunnanensis]|uniref:Uncharacterized protein n=1 Tax=Stephania yunnanensis TaxID=152371 RepID=A0AAP0DZR8_9MAGN
MKLDARETSWVQRAISEVIGKQQWVRRSFRGDSGMLIFQTLENHLGKVMRIWRVADRGWDTILLPGDTGKGWTTFLNGLVSEDEVAPIQVHLPYNCASESHNRGEARREGEHSGYATRKIRDGRERQGSPLREERRGGDDRRFQSRPLAKRNFEDEREAPIRQLRQQRRTEDKNGK